jgi:hypothetical protein
MTIESPQLALDALAWKVAEQGVQRHVDEVRALSQVALALGAPSAVVGVVLDPAQPEVVRQRAFGVMATALASRRDPRIVAA